MTLRTRLTRLAHDNPELRADLLPLLSDKAAAGKAAAGKYRKKKDVLNAVYDLTDEVSEIRRSMVDLGAASGRPKALKDLNRALHTFEDFVKAELGL